jgi:phosphatidylglycerol:prolipoprotein diacylglycerol transferase
MIDSHFHPDHWGIRPILFSVGGLNVEAYPFFVSLGLLAGLLTYYRLAKLEGKASEKSFYVLIAGLFGGILGAKLPIWIINLPEIIHHSSDLGVLLSGRTITGGLIGGALSVIYVKKRLNITDRKGNLFAPAIALGVAIGRLGCFFRGCCYGTETRLPWGVDFGDASSRHPTQIYEIIFMGGMFFYLLNKRKNAEPGELFYLLMNGYFIFRFFEEFIREGTRYFELTFFQYISIAALVFINLKHFTGKINNERVV